MPDTKRVDVNIEYYSCVKNIMLITMYLVALQAPIYTFQVKANNCISLDGMYLFYVNLLLVRQK